MKYFLVLLAVAAVFAQDTIDMSIEDKQQEVRKIFDDNKQKEDKYIEDNQEDLNLETLTNKDDDSNQEGVIPASTHVCNINVTTLIGLISSVVNKRSKTYICMIVHLFTCSCADAVSFYANY